MSEMNIANSDLTKHSQYLEQEQLLMKVRNKENKVKQKQTISISFFLGTNWKTKE